MATRLIGTDDANPRLPALVIAATQGTTSADLAAGNTLAQANAYTDIVFATGGGGGGGGTAEVVFTTRAALNTLADGAGLEPGMLFMITDETPDRFVVATTDTDYVNFLPVSTYTPPAPLGDLRTIAEENSLEGYPPASWQIDGIGDTGALGFTTAMSVRAGGQLHFKIHTGNVAYSLEIVRLGWYGGDGARLVDTLTGDGITQPNGFLRSTGEGGVGSRDCSNWTVTNTWTVPLDATNGLYLGVIKRAGRATFSHVGPFIVDNERGDTADIVCKLSDMTWRAYNAMGTNVDPTSGKSVYGVGAGNFTQGGRCWDVSYDTPLVINGAVAQTSYWNGERPIHAFLEANGYDVHYVSCLDVDADPGRLLGHNVIMSCGHDEYWSQGVRDAWDAAIASGSHAIVASGNTMLWRVRMTGRIMACYKDSHSLDGLGTGTDPQTWTGTWRDTRWEDRRGENESIGTVFVANGIRQDAIAIPATMAAEPMWRNTSVNGLVAPAVETLRSGCLGFEWDSYEPSYQLTLKYPPGIKFLSHTAINLTSNAANENGSYYATTINPAIHRVVAYRRGDALVVNFGTNQWGWGLSDLHVRGGPGQHVTMKQATVNLLADMDCQPATLDAEMSVATNQLDDWEFPTLTALSIPSTGYVPRDLTTQLVATAVWSNGINTDFASFVEWTSSDDTIATVKDGIVEGVTQGECVITATYGATVDTCALTVGPPIPPTDTYVKANYSYTGLIFSDGAITVGSQFRKIGLGSVFVNGVRFWRSTVNQGVAPIVYCAKVGGSPLASKASTNSGAAAAAGWETILFDDAVEITTTDTHIVWVWLPGGGYGAVPGFFTTAPRLSMLGLFDSTTVPGAGKFTQPPGSSSTPPLTAFNNNFYLVEPLVTATVLIVDPGDPVSLTVVPATVTVAIDQSAQLRGDVLWQNIAATNETAFTDWTSSTPAIATVSSGGVVHGVAVGTATVTGTYTWAEGEFTDTCAVTVSSIGHAWTGADPAAVADVAAYELGTWFTVTTTTTLIGVRIWNPGVVNPAGGENRSARLWSHDGTGGSPTVLRTIELPELMPAGWSEYSFANLSATTGVFYCVSYFVHGFGGTVDSDYGAVPAAFTSAVSGSRINFPAGAGRFTPTTVPAVLPTSLSLTNPFYGVDIIYDTA